MNDVVKITYFAQCLDKSSQAQIQLLRETGENKGQPLKYDQIFDTISKRFEPNSQVMKALWSSVTVKNPRGSSHPSVHDWDDFKIQWESALQKVPERVPLKEQYDHLMGQVPGWIARSIRNKESAKVAKFPCFKVEGFFGQTPKQILHFLRESFEMPELQLIPSLANKNISVISMPKTDENEFEIIAHDLRLNDGTKIKFFRQPFTPTPIADIFDEVRQRIEIEDHTN
jgi:hypothetical protein